MPKLRRRRRSTPQPESAESAERPKQRRRRKKVLNRIVENPLIERVSYEEYRAKVRDVYDGPQGAFLEACSLLSLHIALGSRLFRKRKFDLRGAKRRFTIIRQVPQYFPGSK